ncbi:hypothetical protein [Candidatus Methylacidiphilum infernorum]|uniref:hypothetical protein n=1 Tax=Candidatus Methylacidiphilum infernorum TaxID=511746 RepID=UPI0006621AD4|nr:hypothetical protein [Candidatus Methylacidiphilum infernorum]
MDTPGRLVPTPNRKPRRGGRGSGRVGPGKDLGWEEGDQFQAAQGAAGPLAQPSAEPGLQEEEVGQPGQGQGEAGEA